MFKKICFLTVCSIVAISGILTAGSEYHIQDIGTLQTKASEAIAINNRGQILGWYNIDGAYAGKHFFVRDRDGVFHEIIEDYSIKDIPPGFYNLGIGIEWRYLTDDGKAYGTYPNLPLLKIDPVLFMWDKHNGVVKLDIPGEISAINNDGQVLIKSVVVNENGRTIRRPVIWQNGHITKLHGLEGDIGIESEESYGLDMNNKGEVVGHSIAHLSYKNEIYKQAHAVKWVNGKAIDLHNKLRKSTSSQATAINDLGDVIAGGLLIREDGKLISGDYYFCCLNGVKKSGGKYFISFQGQWVLDRDGNKLNPQEIVNAELCNDKDSLWMNCVKIIGINDSGEIIAFGSTIYGENHAMILIPIKSE